MKGKIFDRKMQFPLFVGILCLYNLLLNIPFLRYAAQNLDLGSFSGVFILVSLTVLLVTVNWFACTLVLYLLRMPGKCLVAIINFLSVACVYFILVYNTLMDDTMMGNLYNTQESEASGFINFEIIAFVALFGLLPSIWIVRQKVEWGGWKKFGINVGGSLAATALIIVLNMNNFLWIGEHDTELGGLIMPWSYSINSVRYFNQQRQAKQPEILLPDGAFADDDRTVCVLMIGESSRRCNWSLYSYGRNTNPRLSQRSDIHVLEADANATYTSAGVRAILESRASKELYEILPNYLYRCGADVQWRTTNWGEPPVHVPDYLKAKDIVAGYGVAKSPLDSILFVGLKERILTSDKNKVFIVLHTSTSHGPEYSKRYEKQFEVFTPVSDNVEKSSKDLSGLYNAYDNTVVYTDYLIDNLINMLASLDGWRSSMIYISDHGESLGENNLFMHGVPMSIAPAEQIEIPCVVWTSDNRPCIDGPIDQRYVFHSVLDIMGLDSPEYDPEKDIFRQ